MTSPGFIGVTYLYFPPLGSFVYLHKGWFTWGPKSQVPLKLASPIMETKSEIMRLKIPLKYVIYSLKSDLDYFMQKTRMSCFKTTQICDLQCVTIFYVTMVTLWMTFLMDR